MPYPCKGPRVSSVFRTISASVPCQTSAFLSIVKGSYGFPISASHSFSGNAIRDTLVNQTLFFHFGDILCSSSRFEEDDHLPPLNLPSHGLELAKRRFQSFNITLPAQRDGK